MESRDIVSPLFMILDIPSEIDLTEVGSTVTPKLYLSTIYPIVPILDDKTILFASAALPTIPLDP